MGGNATQPMIVPTDNIIVAYEASLAPWVSAIPAFDARCVTDAGT
jgi:hypothetical protein